MNDGAAPRGMILAAGYGTRLAPLTDHLPKPLLPVPGGTVLDLAVAALDRAGVEQIAVNTHHLAERVTSHLDARPDRARFRISHEPEILGTGGALHCVRDFLAAAPCFLLHNGDVAADVDLGALLDDHRASGALATLVLVPWPAVDSVTVDAGGAVVDIAGRPDGAAGGRRLTYAGIAACDRALLDDIGSGFSSLIDPLVRAIAERPGSVRAFVPQAAAWSDLGTLPRWLERVADAGELRAGDVTLAPLTGHGSPRRFWRLDTGAWSAVIMKTPPDDPEFERGLAIARYLAERDLGAAAPLDVHDKARVVLWEDVGVANLQTLAPSARPQAYTAVVQHLLRLQAVTDDARARCPAATDRALDREQLAWETDYFQERFVVGHLGRTPADLAPLAGELAALNEKVAAQPRVLMHRDFQSQNIHLQGDRVRLVDVQGLRLGPVGYDLASLVWDPYLDLDQELRADLLARFARQAAGELGTDPEAVAAMVRTAALQRLMQALGAFGFLGHVRGKTEFLAHIPRGVAHLRTALAEAGDDISLPGLTSRLAEWTTRI